LGDEEKVKKFSEKPKSTQPALTITDALKIQESLKVILHFDGNCNVKKLLR